jgi:hypothetical protein
LQARWQDRCLGDLWCRCPQCRARNSQVDPRAGHKPPDPLYGRQIWKEHHGSGRAVALQDAAAKAGWQEKRATDFRCVECGWKRAITDGSLSTRLGVSHGGVYYPKGLRVGICERCLLARLIDIAIIASNVRAAHYQEGIRPDELWRTGKGRRKPGHREVLAAALDAAVVAIGASPAELAEATGLNKATISRLRRLVPAATDQMGRPPSPADVEGASGFLRPGRPPIQILQRREVLDRRARLLTWLGQRAHDAPPFYFTEERPMLNQLDRIDRKLDWLAAQVAALRGSDLDDEAIAQAVEDLIADASGEEPLAA